jgi:hypothetical protein
MRRALWNRIPGRISYSTDFYESRDRRHDEEVERELRTAMLGGVDPQEVIALASEALSPKE